jgi:hypothetical protein
MKNDVWDQIAITFDIDWVADEVIQYAVDFLEKYQVKATFFATHLSNYLEALDSSRYEIGLHPNFERDSDYNKTTKSLKALYPEAIGVRSHLLFQSGPLLQVFIDNSLSYESNAFVPLVAGLRPYRCLNKLVSIPCYWGDDYHYLAGFDFELSRLRVDNHGLKVYIFHPIHIFANTISDNHYLGFKQYVHEPAALRKYRHKGRGIGTLFEDLLQYLSRNKLETYTCKEIYEAYISGDNTHDCAYPGR